MEVIYKSCCGIDVHKNKLVACLKIKGKQSVIKEFSGQTEDIKKMADWLKENKCEKIAMESTASYWKPLVNIFEIKCQYKIQNLQKFVGNEDFSTGNCSLFTKNILNRCFILTKRRFCAKLMQEELMPDIEILF